MPDVNHVILIGRLTRDAELKYTTGGAAVAKFAIAVNRRRKNGEQWVDEANFFDVELWGRLAESLNAYLVKGKQVAVEGELRQNRWEQDGQTRSKVLVNATNLNLLGGGQNQAGGQASSGGWQGQAGHTAGGAPSQASQAPQEAAAEATAYNPDDEPGLDFPDDIPF